MPIYHLHQGHVSRSTGRSAVQNAAYITGSNLYETRRDLMAAYENRKEDVVWSKTFAPSFASDEFRELTVWDKIEGFEDEYAIERFPYNLEYRDKYCDSARTAMTLVVALPRELPSHVSIEILEEFAQTRFVSKDLIVTCGMHDDEGNPHGHFLIARRYLVHDEEGNVTFSSRKNRELCTKSELKMTRKLWADFVNSYLERHGIDERVTEKSFADLNSKLLPTKHRGWVSDKLGEMGIDSRLMQENEKIFIENKTQILKDPLILLHEISTKQATFTAQHLLKTIQKRLGDDDKAIASVYEKLIEHAHYVGDGLDGMPRYTTAEYKQKEVAALKTLSSYSEPTNNHAIHSVSVDLHLNQHYTYMTHEQREATIGLTQKEALGVLVGRAGTGKTTTTVKAVCELYKQEGYTVIGGSLSKLASDNLQSEAKINAKTLHAWLYCWDRYRQAEQEFLAFNNLVSKEILNQLHWYKELKRFERFALTDTSVFVLDEAGMVGVDQWSRLLEHARSRNAKVIAVGDDAQCSAIEAGDFFREVIAHAENNGSLYHLNTIQRQKVDWMRNASEKFATLNTQEALALYEAKGHIHEVSAEHLDRDVAKGYCEYLSSSEQDAHGNPKYQTGFVLTYTNEEAHVLNQAIREELRVQNIPGHTLDDTDNFHLGKGAKQKKFAIGDKIVFLKNDKRHVTLIDAYGEVQTERYISNGTTGILEGVKENGKDVVVRLDAYTTAHFSIDSYKEFSHGYALTLHKSQGQTVDFAILVASKFMDAKNTYVGMTRHRHAIDLYYAKEEFSTYKEFALKMSRYDSKDLVKDYTIRSENTEAWRRVHEYQQCIYDAAAVLKDSMAEGDPDWTTYRAIKREQIQLGREIINNYDAHKHYFHQAGFTQEMLEVTMGYKQRPLSVSEEKAKLTVEIYGETAREARALWHEIKLLPNKKAHPSYEEYQTLRDERDALARDILENYPLYREFIKSYAKEYGISKNTLEKQVAYREASIQKKLLADIQKPFNFTTFDKTAEINELHTKESPSVSRTSTTSPQGSSASFAQFERTTTEIAHELREHIEDLAVHFLGHPKQKSRSEWRYGAKGSISIHVMGAKKGLYSNFETGQSGNAVTLIADQLGLSKKDAFKWGFEWLGHAPISHIQMHTQKVPASHSEKQVEASWKPIFPAPHDTPELKNTPSLAYMMRGRVEVALYTYTDAEKNVLGYVVRLEDKKGQKITPTLTYCKNEQGQQMWRWQGFGDDRPLYGLDQLKLKPDAPVLIVEGEKTCEAARKLFPHHVVITWSGGCGSVHKTDWSPLKGRDITLFPDHDEAGLKAALHIGDILNKQGNQTISIVDLPSTLPHKWDLADEIPEHTSLHDLMSHTKVHGELKFEVYQKTHPLYAKSFTELDIRNAVETHTLSFFEFDEKLPMVCYFAQEAYSLFDKMNKINHNKRDSSYLEQKAILTGIYGAWLHEMIDDLQKDKHFVDKVILTGSLTADSKLKKEDFREERTRLFDAYRKILELERKVEEHLKNPPESIKDSTREIQESMIRNAYSYKMVTGENLPTHINKDIFTTLNGNNPLAHNVEVVNGIIHHVLDQKAHGELASHNLSQEMIAFKIAYKQISLQNALQQSQDKSLQIEQQRTVDRELNRGFQLTL